MNPNEIRKVVGGNTVITRTQTIPSATAIAQALAQLSALMFQQSKILADLQVYQPVAPITPTPVEPVIPTP